jgi:hypothetical protein
MKMNEGCNKPQQASEGEMILNRLRKVAQTARGISARTDQIVSRNRPPDQPCDAKDPATPPFEEEARIIINEIEEELDYAFEQLRRFIG